MTKINTREMTVLAILTALTVVLGMYVHIKTPTGLLTLLDAGIYFTAFYFGKREGAIVGGLSGFLIDLLLGYPQWMLVSLLAHGLQGYFAGWSGQKRPMGLVLAGVSMVGLYFLASIFLYNFGEAAAGVLGNVSQNGLGLAVGYLLARALDKPKKRI